jgi:hypothetical protein
VFGYKVENISQRAWGGKFVVGCRWEWTFEKTFKIPAEGGIRTPTVIHHWTLNPARLPVPPLPLTLLKYSQSFATVKSFLVGVLVRGCVGRFFLTAQQTNSL